MSPESIESLNRFASIWIDALWRASWQGAVAATLVLLICVYCPKLPHSVKCALWVLVCFKMLFTLAPFCIHIQNPFSVSQPSPVPLMVRPRGWTPNYLHLNELQLIQSRGLYIYTVRPNWQVWVVLGWLLGVLGLAGYVTWALMKSRRIVFEAEPCEDPRILVEAREIGERLRLRSTPRLMIASQVREVFTFGVLRPVVVFGAKTLEECSVEERRLLLAHEFAHVRRRDALSGLIPQLGQIIFFFNPVVWVAAHEFNLARESECDRIAMELDQTKPKSYGQLLLRLGVAANSCRTLCTPGASSHFHILRRRIAMLDQNSTHSTLHPRRPALLGLGLFSVLLITPMSLVARQPAIRETSVRTRNQPVFGKEPIVIANQRGSQTLVTDRPKKTISTNSRDSRKSFTAGQKRTELQVPLARFQVVTQALDRISASHSQTTTSIYNLRFANADSVSKVLREVFKGESLSIVPDERTNLVVVRGPREMVADALNVLKNLDQPVSARSTTAARIAQETKVFHLKYSSASDVASNLRAMMATDLSTHISADTRANTIIVGATPQRVEEVAQLLDQLDVVPEKQMPTGQPSIAPSRSLDSSDVKVRRIQFHHVNASGIYRLLANSSRSFMSYNPTTNCIVVQCGEAEFKLISDYCARVDNPTSPWKETEGPQY